MSIISDQSFLKALATINIIGLGSLLGYALCMYSISLPVIKSNKSFPTLVMLQQFDELITRGRRYIQTGSRYLLLSMTVQSYLYYRHPQAGISDRWLYFAAAELVMVQVAWYEVVTVFPTNDRLVAMKDEQEKTGDSGVDDPRTKAEVLRLFATWTRWHIGRIVIPLVALTIAIYGIAY